MAEEMELNRAFKLLCLPQNATGYEIKRAYRKACLAVHPDKPGGSAALFRRMTAAYEVCLAACAMFGPAAPVRDDAAPWARAARSFPGFDALAALKVSGVDDAPYDFLYFDGEEEDPVEHVLENVHGARAHFGLPPEKGESPWIETNAFAALLSSSTPVVVCVEAHHWFWGTPRTLRNSLPPSNRSPFSRLLDRSSSPPRVLDDWRESPQKIVLENSS